MTRLRHFCFAINDPFYRSRSAAVQNPIGLPEGSPLKARPVRTGRELFGDSLVPVIDGSVAVIEIHVLFVAARHLAAFAALNFIVNQP